AFPAQAGAGQWSSDFRIKGAGSAWEKIARGTRKTKLFRADRGRYRLWGPARGANGALKPEQRPAL
ncbi:MAG: hypothetical protein ACLPIC_01340, partial [Rhodoblastus sp.]|uniref:hypothetical protein n=1 Tax=Rhodoblastus sp. TaxID=1962975 RepID=UPI003F9BD97A